MFIGTVVDHQIHQNVHIPFFGLGDQPFHVFHRTETGIDVIVIRDVVPLIRQRGGIAGGEPDHVHAKLLQIVQFGDNAGNITDAVSVGIIEAFRIDLICHFVMPPFFRHSMYLFYGCAASLRAGIISVDIIPCLEDMVCALRCTLASPAP